MTNLPLRYFIDGPGEALITATDFDVAAPDLNKILCIVSAKRAAFRGTATEERVTGGRSLAPKRKFLTDREIMFELSDCEMDFRYISFSQGEDIVTGPVNVWAFGEKEQYIIGALGVVTLNNPPIANTLVVQSPEGVLYTQVASAPTAQQYTRTAGTLTFATAEIGKEVRALYQYAATAVKQVSTLSDSIPKTIKLIHNQPMFDANNVILGTQQIEIFKASISGEFEQAYEERVAFAPALTFEVLDPKRHDKKLVDHRIIPA